MSVQMIQVALFSFIFGALFKDTPLSHIPLFDFILFGTPKSDDPERFERHHSLELSEKKTQSVRGKQIYCDTWSPKELLLEPKKMFDE